MPNDAASSRILVPAYPFWENISSAAVKIRSFVPFAIAAPHNSAHDHACFLL